MFSVQDDGRDGSGNAMAGGTMILQPTDPYRCVGCENGVMPVTTDGSPRCPVCGVTIQHTLRMAAKYDLPVSTEADSEQ